MWLEKQVESCAAQSPHHVVDGLHKVAVCTRRKTIHCIQDQQNYSKSLSIMDSFCGFIDPHLLMAAAEWIIKTKPQVTLMFIEFTIESEDTAQCRDAALQIIDDPNEHVLCRRHLPWRYRSQNQLIHLKYYNKHPRIIAEFTIQYLGESSSSLGHAHVTDPTLGPWFYHQGQLRFSSYDVHEEQHYLIYTTRIDNYYRAKVRKCNFHMVSVYDGPGIKSPKLQPENNYSHSYSSSAYQIFFILKYSVKQNGCQSVIIYESHKAHGPDFYSHCKVQEAPRNLDRFQFSFHPSHISNKNIRCRWAFASETDPWVKLKINHLIFDGPQALINHSYCSYGGVFVAEFGSYNIWSGCPFKALRTHRSFSFGFRYTEVEVHAVLFTGYCQLHKLQGELIYQYGKDMEYCWESINFNKRKYPVEYNTFTAFLNPPSMKLYPNERRCFLQYTSSSVIDKLLRVVDIPISNEGGLAVFSQLHLASHDFCLISPKQHCAFVTVHYAQMKTHILSRMNKTEDFQVTYMRLAAVQRLTLNFTKCELWEPALFNMELLIRRIDEKLLNQLFYVPLSEYQPIPIPFTIYNDTVTAPDFFYALHLHRTYGNATLFRVVESTGCRFTNIKLEYVEAQSSAMYTVNWNVSKITIPRDLILTCNPCNILLESRLRNGQHYCMKETSEFTAIAKAVDIPHIRHTEFSSILRSKYVFHEDRFVRFSFQCYLIKCIPNADCIQCSLSYFQEHKLEIRCKVLSETWWLFTHY